jgi:hypothetical protein
VFAEKLEAVVACNVDAPDAIIPVTDGDAIKEIVGAEAVPPVAMLLPGCTYVEELETIF